MKFVNDINQYKSFCKQTGIPFEKKNYAILLKEIEELPKMEIIDKSINNKEFQEYLELNKCACKTDFELLDEFIESKRKK